MSDALPAQKLSRTTEPSASMSAARIIADGLPPRPMNTLGVLVQIVT